MSQNPTIAEELEYFRRNGIVMGETHEVTPVPLEDLRNFAKRSCNRCHGKGFQEFTPAESLAQYQAALKTEYAAPAEKPVARPHTCGCIFKRLPAHVGSYAGGLYYFFEFVKKDEETQDAEITEG